MTVEPACERDIPALLDLADEIGELFGADMARDLSFYDRLGRNIAHGDAYCVRIDGTLAGAMLFRRDRINWLAVRRLFRHQGVGRMLVTHALTSSDGEVRVTTFGSGHPHPDAEPARQFYISLGFQYSNEVAKPADDGTPREIMIRRKDMTLFA